MNTTAMNPPPDDLPATPGHTPFARLMNWNGADSWGDLARAYERLILEVARKSGLIDAEAQDVLQEVLLSVARTFAPRFV